MTASNWPAALAFVWRPENDGNGFHVGADDPGGATSWGVTHDTWAHAVNLSLVPDVPLQDASQDDLARVLRLQFWNVIQGDRLPSGVDLATFNLAMLSGPGRAAIELQAALGIRADGIIGPLTMVAVRGADPLELIDHLTDSEEVFFSGLKNARTNLNGWKRRAEDCRAEALKLCKGSTP